MGTYIIPRNVKGESRILLFFTPKSFLFAIGGLIIGFIIYSLLKMIGAGIVGLVILVAITLIALIIGTVRIPDTKMFDFTKKTGGEALDDVMLRYFKFKKKRTIYIYSEEENKYVETKEKGE